MYTFSLSVDASIMQASEIKGRKRPLGSSMISRLGLTMEDTHVRYSLLTFDLETQQCVSFLVLDARSMEDVELQFRHSYSPMSQLFSGFGGSEEPSNRFIICIGRKAGFLQTRAQERYGLTATMYSLSVVAFLSSFLFKALDH